MKICVHCIVEGQVQGVFFRASTQQQAEKLGLTGFAHNRADGGVDVLACGEKEAVAQLCEWLKSGPPAAQVETVSCRENELLKIDNFATG
ncbi:MAG TPA: acylphosphatase [Gammaproteobacteria bacterium]|nr:acylphosphatase [Gammaproteobacteria bacterium]